ncbi:GntR family transcriptional regulator [Paraburkholderia sp. 22B1P]|uniref:GntR family transcriptional regulator n=1 Tax=Paraburkholderia sp. 22B1P TaxID=3080498 RepID=UPI003084D5BD|nr:GntR family transcriptional regulator [Paraburkholderia sp. 22B1P]
MSDDPTFTVIEQFPAPLRQVVIARLRGAIISGSLRPGDRLVEARLTEALKVSRPSLREAMRQLEAEGLVEIIPNRGPIVKRLTRDETRETYDLLGAVEALCARHVASYASDEAIERLESTVDAVEAALKSEDREAIVRAKHLYYEAFAAGCNSELIRSYLRQLLARVSFVWSSSLRFPGRPTEFVREMRRLVEAIRARDPEAAAATAQMIVRHASTVGLSSFDSVAHDAGPPVAKTRRKSRIQPA